jgi:hypothetical protein
LLSSCAALIAKQPANAVASANVIVASATFPPRQTCQPPAQRGVAVFTSPLHVPAHAATDGYLTAFVKPARVPLAQPISVGAESTGASDWPVSPDASNGAGERGAASLGLDASAGEALQFAQGAPPPSSSAVLGSLAHERRGVAVMAHIRMFFKIMCREVG